MNTERRVRWVGVGVSMGLFKSTTPCYFMNWLRNRFSSEQRRAADEFLEQYTAGCGSGEMAHAFTSTGVNDAFNRKFNVSESMHSSSSSSSSSDNATNINEMSNNGMKNNNNSNSSSSSNKWSALGVKRRNSKASQEGNFANTTSSDDIDYVFTNFDEHNELTGSRRIPITHAIERVRMQRQAEQRARKMEKEEESKQLYHSRNYKEDNCNEVDERKEFWKRIDEKQSLHFTQSHGASATAASTQVSSETCEEYDKFNMPRHPENEDRKRAYWEYTPTPEHKSLVLLLYRNLLKGLINFKSVRRRSLIAYARIVFRRRASATEKLLIDECIEECRRAIYVIQKHHDMIDSHEYEFDSMAVPKDTGQDVKTYMEEVYDPEVSRAQFQNFNDVQPGKENMHQQSLSPTNAEHHWQGTSNNNGRFKINIKDEDKALRPPPPPTITQRRESALEELLKEEEEEEEQHKKNER